MDEQNKKLKRNENEEDGLTAYDDEVYVEERVSGREVYEWVRSFVTAVVVVVLLFVFVARMTRVDGSSMNPTLWDGDRLMVVNSLLCGDYHYGDIVTASDKNFIGGKAIVKRVIATGGQTVDIDFDLGIVYVDGEALDEPYIADRTYLEEGTVFPLTLGENELFLMGDNRNHSNDSRDYRLGPVDRSEIIGRAVWLVFPGKDELDNETIEPTRHFSRIGRLN